MNEPFPGPVGGDAPSRSDDGVDLERPPRNGERGRPAERVTRLERIDGVVRDVGRAVVRATDREEIDRAVCERLADAYGGVWIGDGGREPGRTRVRHRAGGGAALCELADSSERAADRPPWIRALETGEPRVVDDVREGAPDPVREAAAEDGVRSLCSVPIRYGGSPYGVLTVCAARPGAFGEVEREAVAELGETVGHAIDAVESKRATVADAPVELEFRVPDPEFRALALAREVDCRVTVGDVSPQPDGTAIAYVTTSGGTPAAVERAVADAPGVERIRCIDAEGADGGDRECLFECHLSESLLTTTLLEHGAILRTITADAADGSARVVIELGRGASVREFVEAFAARFPGARPVARRIRDRPTDPALDCRSALFDRLTDRQREVLTAAYHSGFYESPRLTTAQELAVSLGVSQPTISGHVRAAERALFEYLFEDRE